MLKSEIIVKTRKYKVLSWTWYGDLYTMKAQIVYIKDTHTNIRIFDVCKYFNKTLTYWNQRYYAWQGSGYDPAMFKSMEK